MLSRLLCKRVFPLQSYLDYSSSCSILSHIFQNAFFSKVSGDSPIANKLEKGEQVRTLLRNYGLSDTQLSTISKMHPKVFQFHPQNVLLPKLDFLRSIGVSSDILLKIILSNHWLLQRNLENQLIPCYNFLKNLPLADKDIVGIIRRNSRILGTNVEKIATNLDALQRMGVPQRNSRILGTNVEKIATNLDALQRTGVPQSSILYMMAHHPSLVQLNCEKLKLSIDEAISLGFNPLRMLFVQAVLVLCESSKETWENKVKVYRSFGLSDVEIKFAFRAHPFCMKLSEDKIARGMDFFVNEMRWSPGIVARRPSALFFHFEKRIVPRCRVIKVLMQKGLVKEHRTLIPFLGTTEEQFLDKFVCKYRDVFPELKDVYASGLILKHN
ncbi:Mitochondrial transcription termination factor family protein [Forsythia ovata]|uniref:Mitochondrial transcription termination factor family protein n=1 Tax=Forsythia ovata TaxID=205694 RepID=A0ABD1X3Z7_9LAMI